MRSDKVDCICIFHSLLKCVTLLHLFKNNKKVASSNAYFKVSLPILHVECIAVMI